MKKYSKLAVALLMGCCLLQAGQALADTYTTLYFDDNTLYFPDADPSKGALPSTESSPPYVTGMYVTVDDQTHMLQSIQVIADSSSYLNWNNLLIDTNGSTYGDWDYLVHSGGTQSDPYGFVSPVDNGVYTVAPGYNYTYGLFDQGQPNGIKATDLTLKDSTITGVQTGSGPYTLTYDLSSLDIVVTSDFVIGWVSFCGNDPMLAYGGKGEVVPNPEPATMMLFGMGMASLAGWRARQAKKKK